MTVVMGQKRPIQKAVMPAKAGIHSASVAPWAGEGGMGSRLRGNDAE